MTHTHALNPARSIRAAAHQAMAFAALHANTSLASRLTRYNRHMQKARAIAGAVPATKAPEDILAARLQQIEQAKSSDLLHHHWSAAFGAASALRAAALLGLEQYRQALTRLDNAAEARAAQLEEVRHG